MSQHVSASDVTRNGAKLDAGWRSEARGVEEHGTVERGERV